jgi:hypothetical protein
MEQEVSLTAEQVAERFNLPNPRWVKRRSKTLFKSARVEFSPRNIRYKLSRLTRIVEHRNGNGNDRDDED